MVKLSACPSKSVNILYMNVLNSKLPSRLTHLGSCVCIAGSWWAYGRRAPGNSESWPAAPAGPETLAGLWRSQAARDWWRASAMTATGWDCRSGSASRSARRPGGIRRRGEEMAGVEVWWWLQREGGIRRCCAGKSCPCSCCAWPIWRTGSASAAAAGGRKTQETDCAWDFFVKGRLSYRRNAKLSGHFALSAGGP